MTARSPSAFLLSVTLHAVLVGVALLLSYSAAQQNPAEPAKVFELVAGEGDNYLATEAPALGTPGGTKVTVQTPKFEPLPPAPEPEPEPEPVQPAPVQPAAPVQPTPKPAVQPAPKPVETEIPNFTKKIKREMIVAESRAKLQLKKERAAQAKKEAEAKKAAEEESKRMSKAEFDRLNKSKSQPTTRVAKSGSAKAPKIDAEGIAKGVVGGSTKNKTGGAGGKALVASNGTALEAYYALFKQRLKERFEPPPGLSDTLVAVVSVTMGADGTITNPRIIESSGSREFDEAVLDAVRRMRMPARPDGKSETVKFPFTLRERDEL